MPSVPARRLASFRLLWFASALLIVAWASVGVTAIAAVVSLSGLADLSGPEDWLWRVGFMGPGFTYMAFACFPKCDSCRSRILLDTGRGKHPDAVRHGFSRFSHIAVAVVRGRNFRCMYCGTEYRAGFPGADL